MSRTSGWLGFFLGCVALAGCSQTTQLPNVVKVSGRVTDGGTPLHVDGRDIGLGRVVVGFYPIDGEDSELVEVTSADVDADGNFDVIDGVVPGKYRISVRQWDPYDTVDRLENRFDGTNSKIVRQIDQDTSELNIDVANPDGLPASGEGAE